METMELGHANIQYGKKHVGANEKATMINIAIDMTTGRAMQPRAALHTTQKCKSPEEIDGALAKQSLLPWQ